MSKQNTIKTEMQDAVLDETAADTIRDNYEKNAEEIDQFSKRLTNVYMDLNTELIYGSLNVVQHYLDLQKKYSQDFPEWHPSYLITEIVKRNFESWVQMMQNIDNFYVESIKSIKNNIRTINKNSNLMIQSFDQFYETYKNNI